MNELQRKYYLDWLRIFAFAIVVPYHSALIFIPNTPFPLKTDTLSLCLMRFVFFLNEWHMPLLFLISGAAMWLSLDVRSGREYTRERFLRLFVPFVFGMLVIVPPQLYIELVLQHHFFGSFFRFYPRLFTTGSYLERIMNFYHLWFLLYLFMISIIALPLLMMLKRKRPVLARIEAWFEKGPRIFLPFLAFTAGEVVFRRVWPNGYHDITLQSLESFILFFITFIFGFILFSGDGYRRSFERNRLLALAIGGTLSVVYLFIFGILNKYGVSVPNTKAIMFVMLTTCGLCTWCWLIAFLGYFSKYANFTNRIRVYTTGAILPFYILHQTVIVIIGYYVIRLNTSVPVKYTIIVILTYIITFFIYDLVIKRIRPLRFLFGMKTK
jgi:glucan biosynthesis protein C